MDETKNGRRERRRRKVEMKMEGNHLVENEFQKAIENVELSIKTHETQSLGKLFRRDTYTVLHSNNNNFGVRNVPDMALNFNVKSGENSETHSTESKNLTYSLNKDSDRSINYTFNIDKPPEPKEIPPVPAPRKRKSVNLEQEKVSSDTDRDITEIDLDDLLIKSPKSDFSSKPSPVSNDKIQPERAKSDSIVPVPKPRKTVRNLEKSEKSEPDFENSEFESLKSSTESSKSKTENVKSKNVKQDLNEDSTSGRLESNELPLLESLQDKVKSDEVEQKTENLKKLVGELFDGKNKKKKLSSLIKLDKKKIPKISSILKDTKKETKENKPELEEEKIDFQIDSPPHYTESAENGRIYVQGKNGFHVMEKDEVLKSRSQNPEKEGNGGMMEDSTVKTAIFFQKYWSKFMTYFHGILAGFGFSHAATVTAIMLHFNYDPEGFIAVYSCLSLKIHYVFYTLIALCIVSCFDRIDIGHINRKHWQIAWKTPSLWIILNIYMISFVLTFANQKIEVRLDAFPNGNETEIWEDQTQSQIQMSLLQWYYSVWARDVLVLFAWLMIALSNFDDFLFSHVNNMAKYAETIKERKTFRHKTDLF